MLSQLIFNASFSKDIKLQIFGSANWANNVLYMFYCTCLCLFEIKHKICLFTIVIIIEENAHKYCIEVMNIICEVEVSCFV